MKRTGRPTTLAFNGMVAAPHSLASAAGLAVLREGGSAADAVIAANAVLTVIYPDQTSIGGDCFLIYHDAASGKTVALNGSGRSPKAAERERLRSLGHASMPSRGIHSVTVPGTIDAWFAINERFGRMGMDRLLAPAIGYARDGFPVSPNLHDSLQHAQSHRWLDESFRSTYFPGGAVLPTGSRMRLPELAMSLERIANEGRDLFYSGEIGERLIATSSALGGFMTADDLAGHRAEWVEPIYSDYRGVSVAEFPPNSQGITALIELNLAEQRDEASWGTAEHLHPLIEAKKIAFDVRDRYLTDPAHAAINVEHLVSKSFARELWEHYDPARAGTGNAASLIQSIYLDFGSGVLVDGTGVVLQCRGAYFSLDDDHPNRLEGGKRPLHTLMPGMLFQNGSLLGPIGAQGGDAQAQVHLQLITNLVDYGMDPQQAIEAPRWVAGGHDPRSVGLEGRFAPSTITGLTQRGHHVAITDAWNVHYGHAQMILRDQDSGLLMGGADPRADGVAIGY